MKENKTKKRFFIIAVCFFLAAVYAFWQWPDNKLHLVVCDVGQGDAILISRGATQILIDGGPDNQVLNCLGKHMPFWDRQVEMVILTHPEKDHGGGLVSVLERYKVKYFVSGVLGSSALFYQKLLAVISKSNAQLINPWSGDELAIGGVKLLFFWPDKDWVVQQLSDRSDGQDYGDISKTSLIYQRDSEAVLGVIDEKEAKNNFCSVFRVSYGDFTALLTGDADSRIQPEILATVSLPQVDVLKVAHHGSKYAFLDDFLIETMPKLAIISVGKNPWGQPTKELLDQLEKFGIPVRRTDKDGTVEVVSDGRRWWVL